MGLLANSKSYLDDKVLTNLVLMFSGAVETRLEALLHVIDAVVVVGVEMLGLELEVNGLSSHQCYVTKLTPLLQLPYHCLVSHL